MNQSQFKKLLLVSILFIIPQLSIAADSTHFSHVVSTAKNSPPTLGREIWVALAQNYDAGGGNGKYYMLYVTSPKATTVNIALGANNATKFPVASGKVVAFNIPLSWEMTTSGEVENKGIHVWSDDADISAYVLSRNPATSDGLYAIPTVGWGKDYVVAGYHSLYELSFDYPSEFTVVAQQNATSVSIIPTQDIRKTKQPNLVLHPKGSQFTEVLNRGQSVQYQLTQAQNADEWDVTGTLVSSNHIVGIVGASQCPNIPPSNTYCDHICDMIPPIRTWASTYYSVPFANRKGGDSFCMIPSKGGQTIYREDSVQGKVVETVLNQFEPFFDPGIDRSAKWTSDAPFMLAQYINSTDWPTSGANNGIGDPAMVVINGTEQFAKTVVFQTPTILGGQATFQNFVNVVYKTSSESNTFFDGVSITSTPGAKRLNFKDPNYRAARIASVKQGTHTVTSDTGVGVYIYGYGSYDSYAWAGALGNRTVNSLDTLPTVAKFSERAFQAKVALADISPTASKISSVVIDSLVNLGFKSADNFMTGEGSDSTYYELQPVDPFAPGFARVFVYDVAGNKTVVNSVYTPISATPGTLTFDSLPVFGPARMHSSIPTQHAKLTNRGTSVLSLENVWIDDSTHFSIVRPQLPTLLQEGESIRIRIAIESIEEGVFETTLHATASGSTIATGIVRGTITPDSGYLSVVNRSISFDTSALNAQQPVRDFIVKKTGFATATISALGISGSPFFIDQNDPANKLPVTLGESETHTFHVSMKTDSIGEFSDRVIFSATNGDTDTSDVFGSVKAAASVAMARAGLSDLAKWLEAGSNADGGVAMLAAPSPNPVTSIVKFSYALRSGAEVSLSIYDLLGKQVASLKNSKFEPRGIHEVQTDLKALPAGLYRYVFTVGPESRSGQIVVEH